MQKDYAEFFSKALYLVDPAIHQRVLSIEEDEIYGLYSKFYKHSFWYNKVIGFSRNDYPDKLILKYAKYFKQYHRWTVYPELFPEIDFDQLFTRHGYFRNYTLMALKIDLGVALETLVTGLNPQHIIKVINDPEEKYDVLSKIYPSDSTEAHKEDYMYRQENSVWQEGDLFVAYHEGIPVGTANYLRIPDSNYAYLYRAYVLDEYRGEGFYSSLLQERVIQASKDNVSLLTIANKATSYEILKRKGFVDVFEVYMFEKNEDD